MGGDPAPRSPRRDRTGTWFADDRGVARRLKVSWHPERRLFVLSVWHEDTCTATFRLPLGEVPRLIGTLVEALGQALGQATTSGPPTPSGPLGSRARALTRALPEAWRRRWGRDD